MERFDELTISLAGSASRRGVLRGLAAGAAMVLVGTAATAAKPGNGKGKANGRNKVGVCHQTEDGAYQYKRLPAPAARAHARHGDPVDDACNTVSVDEAGDCITTPRNENLPCDELGNVCVNGACTTPPAPPPPPE